jgi:hypothetical protein
MLAQINYRQQLFVVTTNPQHPKRIAKFAKPF